MSDQIKAPIKALLDKTTASGCTEAEAMAAAAKAAELMRNHGLAPEDLVFSEARIGRIAKSATRHTLYRVIASATNTVIALYGDDVGFVFDHGDTERAHWGLRASYRTGWTRGHTGASGVSNRAGCWSGSQLATSRFCRYQFSTRSSSQILKRRAPVQA